MPIEIYLPPPPSISPCNNTSKWSRINTLLTLSFTLVQAHGSIHKPRCYPDTNNGHQCYPHFGWYSPYRVLVYCNPFTDVVATVIQFIVNNIGSQPT